MQRDRHRIHGSRVFLQADFDFRRRSRGSEITTEENAVRAFPRNNNHGFRPADRGRGSAVGRDLEFAVFTPERDDVSGSGAAYLKDVRVGSTNDDITSEVRHDSKDHVIARATIHTVRAFATIDVVVSAAGVHRVGSRPTDECVLALAAVEFDAPAAIRRELVVAGATASDHRN